MTSVSAYDLFLTLLAKILPLYAMIGLGYFAGQRLKVAREAIATLLIYTITPVVFFGATAQMKIDHSYLLLPFVIFTVSAVLGLLAYRLAAHIWQDGRKNIVGFTMGTANQGYFGIPVFLALFGPDHLGFYVYTGLGFSLYESTIGYYLMARGAYSVRDSLFRLFRLPLIPAAILGVCFSLSGLEFSQAAKDFYATFKGAYTVLGMMLVGFGLGSIRHLGHDFKFTGFVFALKFLVWPLVAYSLLKAYASMGGEVGDELRHVIILLSALPLAANAAAFATQMKVEPQKAATVVFLSTLFALVYIPLVMSLL